MVVETEFMIIGRKTQRYSFSHVSINHAMAKSEEGQHFYLLRSHSSYPSDVRQKDRR